jgi:hypothetical protein
VAVENTGLNPVAVGAVTLSFTGAADRTGEYTVTPAPANPTTIAGGATGLFDFAVDVSPAAALETIVIDAAFSGSDAITARALSDPGADSDDTWDVVDCISTTCGDCNGDGVISILDALAAAQHGVGSIVLAPAAFSNCNVTGLLEPDPGAVVSILDALAIAQVSAGLSIPLACC